jgi:probable rRNA maturation factor
MAPADRGLRVTVTDGYGRRWPRRSGAAAKAGAPGLATWLRRAAPKRVRGEVTVALVGDARMRALNRMYRGKDYATDVLSFPAEEGRKGRKGRKGFPLQPFQPFPPLLPTLGDIVIATGVAGRQARDLGHSLAVELRILSLHGLLHLLGYDHERDRGRMRTLEQRLLRQSGVRNGLIERVHA